MPLPWGGNSRPALNTSFQKPKSLCARHHLKKVVGLPMSHPMGRRGTSHFFSLPSQTPLQGSLCIWLLGPAPCAVNTAPEAGRPAEDLGLPSRDLIKGNAPPTHTHTPYLHCLVRGWFWRARPRPAEASNAKVSLSLSSLLFSPSGAAAPTAGRQEPWFAATTTPRT